MKITRRWTIAVVVTVVGVVVALFTPRELRAPIGGLWMVCGFIALLAYGMMRQTKSALNKAEYRTRDFDIAMMPILTRCTGLFGVAFLALAAPGIVALVTASPTEPPVPDVTSTEVRAPATTPTLQQTLSPEEIDKSVAYWNKVMDYYGQGVGDLASTLSDGYPRENVSSSLDLVTSSDDTAESWAETNVPGHWQDVRDALVEGLSAHKQLAEKAKIALFAHPDGDVAATCGKLMEGVPQLLRAQDMAREHIKSAGGDSLREYRFRLSRSKSVAFPPRHPACSPAHLAYSSARISLPSNGFRGGLAMRSRRGTPSLRAAWNAAANPAPSAK